MSEETKTPAKLADMGDVLSDADLAALMQRKPCWPRRERDRAKALGVAPNLPASIPGFTRPRYRRVDVERWLLTGSRVPVRLARIAS